MNSFALTRVLLRFRASPVFSRSATSPVKRGRKSSHGQQRHKVLESRGDRVTTIWSWDGPLQRSREMVHLGSLEHRTVGNPSRGADLRSSLRARPERPTELGFLPSDQGSEDVSRRMPGRLCRSRAFQPFGALVLLDHIRDGPRGRFSSSTGRRHSGQVPIQRSSTCCSCLLTSGSVHCVWLRGEKRSSERQESMGHRA